MSDRTALPRDAATRKRTLTDQLLDNREALQRDTFTASERATFWIVLIALVLLSWIPDPRSGWILGWMLTLALICPAIIRLHRIDHPFFIGALWRKWGLLLIPVWVVLFSLLIGSFNQSLIPVNDHSGDLIGHTLGTPSSLVPSAPLPAHGWASAGVFMGFYAIALNILFAPKSRAFFLRLLPWLSLNAVLLALLGYAQLALGASKIFGMVNAGHSGFFSTFHSEGSWLVFALLWSGVMLSLGVLQWRVVDEGEFDSGLGPWYFSGAGIVGGSALVMTQGITTMIYWSVLAFVFGMVAYHFFRTRIKNRRSGTLWGIGMSLVAIGAAALAVLQNPTANSDTAFIEAAKMLFAERPLLGWGTDSFSAVAPFFVSDFHQPGGTLTAAHNGYKFLAQYGLIGLFFFAFVPLILVTRVFIRRDNFRLTNQLLLVSGGALITASISVAYFTPAVAYSHWLIFFIGIRWADVSRMDSDLIDARPHLVVSAQNRRQSVTTPSKKRTSRSSQ